MLLESLTMMVRGLLRIPPGTVLRKVDGPSTSSANYGNSIKDNDYASIIVSITTDDVCIGDKPLSLNYDVTTPESVSVKFDQIKDECNTIVKWATTDLLVKGVSVYQIVFDKKKNIIYLNPYIKPLDFYYTWNKQVVAYSTEDNSSSKKNVEDLLIFINYDKGDLVEITDKDFKSNSKLLFKINPSPMQMKNIDKTLSAIDNIEEAILRDRMLRRPIRYATVEVGVSQGTTQKNVADTVSSALNANSNSLTPTSNTYEFDDNIPVIPVRKTLGAPTITESIPTKSEDNLQDLQYFVGKLNLGARFPGSYLNFSEALKDTAVSMIRSDLRYYNLCSTVRSKVETVFNDFINSTPKFAKYHPVFSLASPPSSQTDDITQSLDTQIDFATKVHDFIMSDDVPKEQFYRLQLLQDLFAASTNSPLITKWLQDYRTYILDKLSPEEKDDLGIEDDTMEDSSEEGSWGAESEETSTNESPEDVEFIEPQTTL